MATTTTTDNSSCQLYQILLDQRRRYNYFIQPPPRIELQSPYPTFTPMQLNMRRKAEILKYRNTQSNTKTNNLTRNQQYALLARGNANPYSEYTISVLNNPALQPYYYGYTLSGVNGQILSIGTQVYVTGFGYYPKDVTVAGRVFSLVIQFAHYASIGQVQAIISPTDLYYTSIYNAITTNYATDTQSIRYDTMSTNDVLYQILYSDQTVDIVNSKYISIMTVKQCVQADNVDNNPTWSTASDVPGSPILITLDPTVPLYNYITNRDAAYSETVIYDNSVFKLYTQNELQYILDQMFNSQYDTIDSAYQTRTFNIGSIIITGNAQPQDMTFDINIPIGVWYRGSIGYGIVDTSNCPDISTNPTTYYQPHYDSTGVYKTFQDKCYAKPPGAFLPSDIVNIQVYDVTTQSTVQTANNPGLTMNVTYSNTPVTLETSYDVSGTFTDVSFSLYNVNPTHFYGIQYVGSLNISNINLAVQPFEVFDLNLTMSYTYYDSLDAIDKLDYFATGLFFNLSTESQNVCEGITLSSSPSSPFVQSSFTSYTPGSMIPISSPTLTATPNISAGPVFASITNIVGNLDHVTIERTGYSPAIYRDITGDQFVDTGLVPNQTYSYTITPVLNYMNGSTVSIGTVTTNPISIFGYVDPSSITMTSMTIYIDPTLSNYTYYDILRYDGSQTTTIPNLTSTTYVDASLVPGVTYQYSLIPFVVDPFGYPWNMDVSYVLPMSYTTKLLSITSAVYEVMPTYITIVVTGGGYDTFSVVRSGNPILTVFDLSANTGNSNLPPANAILSPSVVLPPNTLLHTDPSSRLMFTDYSSQVSPGSQLQYYLVPNRYGIDGSNNYLNPISPYLTTIPLITISATYGVITYSSISIKNFTGYFTSFQVTRTDLYDGSVVTLSNSLTVDPASFTDYTSLSSQQTGLVFTDIGGLQPYHLYTYTLTPFFSSKYNKTATPVKGSPFVMSSIKILDPIPNLMA
jgi:hypothetical protein